MDRENFENLVQEALNELPGEFQEKLENVAIVVEEWPTQAQLDSVGIRPPGTLFGLYHGVPKIKRGSYYSALPDKISIFAGPILATSTNLEAIKERIKQVVQHEIAHHFGLSEKEVRSTEMFQSVLFKNRTEAGQKLAKELKKLNLKNPVVLAIPSGGVPIGAEVTKVLNCPLDLIIVRKIQYPWTTEAGFGAVAADGTLYLGPGAAELSEEQIKVQTQKAQEEVKHRQEEFLKNRKPVEVSGKTVILVDDGLAAGSTMICAAKSVHKKNPAEIVVAAPTASSGAVRLLEKEADKIITLYTHPEGLSFAVASSYKYWHDLTDEEVKEYLKEANEDKRN